MGYPVASIVMAKTHHMTRKYGSRSGSFAAQIAEYKESLDDLVNDAVLELYSGLVKGTPVGNPSLWKVNRGSAKAYVPKGYVGGSARANWRIVETPDDEVIHSTSNGAVPVLPVTWTKLYIINNMPYMVPLEYGHSSQVEIGWIRKNIDNFEQLLSELSRARPE